MAVIKKQSTSALRERDRYTVLFGAVSSAFRDDPTKDEGGTTMKKIIVVLLTLLMITAVLTACGKAQDQPTESNDASADTSAKTPPPKRSPYRRHRQPRTAAPSSASPKRSPPPLTSPRTAPSTRQRSSPIVTSSKQRISPTRSIMISAITIISPSPKRAFM